MRPNAARRRWADRRVCSDPGGRQLLRPRTAEAGDRRAGQGATEGAGAAEGGFQRRGSAAVGAVMYVGDYFAAGAGAGGAGVAAGASTMTDAVGRVSCGGMGAT